MKRKNKNRLELFLLITVLFVPALAQSDETTAGTPDIRVTFVRDSSNDRQPALTAFPSYPSVARRDRIEGEATVCFHVDVRGKVKSASIESYTHKIFRKPALRAIRKSSFEPLLPDQVLSRSKTCRTYRFRLDPILAKETHQ